MDGRWSLIARGRERPRNPRNSHDSASREIFRALVGRRERRGSCARTDMFRGFCCVLSLSRFHAYYTFRDDRTVALVPVDDKTGVQTDISAATFLVRPAASHSNHLSRVR